MRLEGKTALVTGAGTGIGAAIAHRLVADGARVCLVGRRQSVLDETLAELPVGSAVTVSADISIAGEVDGAVGVAVEFGKGSLDIVVNNAGIGPVGTIEDCDVDEWNQALAVNLTGPMLVTRAAIPYLRRNGGAVVNISSVAGRRAFPGLAAYCVSKAGLIMLTQQAAVDFGADGIRFNAVCPGWIRTPMSEQDMQAVIEIHGGDVDSAFALVSRDTPLRRVAEPSEIAGVISFLASDDASFVSGEILAADGGSTVLDVSTLAFYDRSAAVL
ncbi:3-oxoacyl-[acyl-carrier protein] reductase [Rhodococcus wratislaviensis]|uniref:3-oxoacyl-[acyl-carrier protein] reductase n=1 Tax=Rhodococcus wratislaviensis TaxID=44752 RepID=A0A402CNA8_RHOWR|nr:SDR family NAD(P)-dependent oxidoreductase [Rhodococcus wratislaviensis]GCE45009.1 3-oxoacyl-[acyl-carrier protein] reductase [Rhodococcus wratislaviensis]